MHSMFITVAVHTEMWTFVLLVMAASTASRSEMSTKVVRSIVADTFPPVCSLLQAAQSGLHICAFIDSTTDVDGRLQTLQGRSQGSEHTIHIARINNVVSRVAQLHDCGGDGSHACTRHMTSSAFYAVYLGCDRFTCLQACKHWNY